MPVLDAERVSTRSAVRYRPLPTKDQTRPGPLVARRSRVHPGSSAPARNVAPDDLDLEKEEKRAPRWQPATPPSPRHVTTPPVHARSRVRPWFFVGIGLLFAVLLWIGVSQVIAWGLECSISSTMAIHGLSRPMRWLARAIVHNTPATSSL